SPFVAPAAIPAPDVLGHDERYRLTEIPSESRRDHGTPFALATPLAFPERVCSMLVPSTRFRCRAFSCCPSFVIPPYMPAPLSLLPPNRQEVNQNADHTRCTPPWHRGLLSSRKGRAQAALKHSSQKSPMVTPMAAPVALTMSSAPPSAIS